MELCTVSKHLLKVGTCMQVIYNECILPFFDRPSWKSQADEVVRFRSSLVICDQFVLHPFTSKLYPHVYSSHLLWFVHQRRNQVGDNNQVAIHFHVDIVLTESMMVSLVSSYGRVMSMKGQAPPYGPCLPSLTSVASMTTVVSGWLKVERLLTKHTSWLMHYSLSQQMQMKYVTINSSWPTYHASLSTCTCMSFLW